MPGHGLLLGGGAGGAGLAPAGSLLQKFDTGATRSADTDKNDYEGFMSFTAIEEFGDYMSRHRTQADGSVRDSDNWQKGIPLRAYVKSLLRHSLELWGLHRGYRSRRLGREYPGRNFNFLKRETACAIWFNVQGFLHELLKEGNDSTPGPDYYKNQELVKQLAAQQYAGSNQSQPWLDKP